MARSSLYLATALAALSVAMPAYAQDAAADLPEGDGAPAARQRVTEVTPYIEAAQVLTAQLQPGDDFVTYTSLAAGVDATVTGRNSAASIAARYERRIGWSDNALDGDTISGVARGSLALVPRAITLEAGAMAARTRVDGTGAASIGGFGGNAAGTSQIFALYAGPSVATRTGDFDIQGHYRFGYTSVQSPDALPVAAGGTAVDVFDDSIVHSAQAGISLRPQTVLPIGLGIAGGWNEQHISNLDQRIRDRYLRASVTVPITHNAALLAGIGYEDVQVSSRDARRDASGAPLIGADGRYVTDDAAPRLIAYDTDGLIWDAGVLWRPSRRTSLEAHVGRRYGSTTYYGTFAYAPTARQSMAISVYDTVTAFGGALVNTLAGLPARFDAFRNPITGEIGGCVAAEGGGCLTGALGSIRSSVFRNRGVAGSYTLDLGRTQIGAGAGYDRRRFIAAAGTVLAGADGLTDENVWIAAYAARRLDERSSLNLNASANWFDSGFASISGTGSGTFGYSTSLAYNRQLMRRLAGTAAVGLDGITRDSLPDFMTASALLGLRYSF